MSADTTFFDTNVLLYLLSADTAKAERAEIELGSGGVISVQVLNEFTAVASRKLQMPMTEIREILDTIRAVCRVAPLTEETHDLGLSLIERYSLSVYDAMIVAAALDSKCRTIASEDLQDGQVFERTLKVRNPFVRG